MTTTSSQRSNFQPAALIMPTWSKPSARCTPIEPALAESPITASIWRAPAASQRASSSARSSRPKPRPRRVGGEVDRILEAEAIGRARPELVRVGVAAAPRRRARATSQGRPLATHVVAAARHLGAVGRVELEGAGAVAHVPAVDGGRWPAGRSAVLGRIRIVAVMALRGFAAEFIMRGFSAGCSSRSFEESSWSSSDWPAAVRRSAPSSTSSSPIRACAATAASSSASVSTTRSPPAASSRCASPSTASSTGPAHGAQMSPTVARLVEQAKSAA